MFPFDDVIMSASELTHNYWGVLYYSEILHVTHDATEDHIYAFLVRSECRLTQWGQVTHICVSKQTIIGSDTGLSPSRRQAITWIHDGILDP